MLFLALSCFQGRTMTEAARTLVDLAPRRVGLQLTPGCTPSPIEIDCPLRSHHGFDPHALRGRVWDDGRLVWQGESLHPPRVREVPDDWTPPPDAVLETMYPGYAALACGDQLLEAMDEGRRIAVDIAHLSIQRFHGLLDDRVLNRLLEYTRVAEVHVSSSRDSRDVHAGLSDETWGVEWARDRLRLGIPTILECYMHKLSHEQRLEQVAKMLE